LRPIVCFGEALIDFLHVNQINQDGIALKEFRQFPGGAPANAAVAVAKLGGNVEFAGQVGDDSFGHFLIRCLQEYGVDTNCTLTHPTAKTALAFVSRDESGERSFEFYRDKSADMMFQQEQISDDWFTEASILHFCSNTLTNSEIAATTKACVEKAKAASSLVSFDVNLRDNLWANNCIDIALVNELTQRCDLIKYSKEEIDLLSQGTLAQYIDTLLDAGVKLILITDGAKAISYFTPKHSGEIQPPRVNAVDTNASGDTFIGAMLRCLSEVSNLSELTSNHPERLETLISFAAQCSAYTVTREGAFTAMPNFDAVKEYWPF